MGTGRLLVHKNFANFLAQYELSYEDMSGELYAHLSEKYDELVEVKRMYDLEDSFNVVMYEFQTLCLPNYNKERLGKRMEQLEQEIYTALFNVMEKQSHGISR